MALTDNLVAYWKLDESSGNAADSAGGSYTLTNNNTITYTTGKINNGATLTRASSMYFSSTNAIFNINNSFSISMWVKLVSSPSSNFFGLMSKKYSAGGLSWAFSYGDVGGTKRLKMYTEGAGGADSYITPTALNTGQWYHLVAVKNGTTSINFYIDGVKFLATGTIYNTTSGLNSFEVGHGNLDASDYWDGMIDEVCIYDKVLSDTEVSILYNNNSGFQYDFSSGTVTANFYVGSGDGYVRYSQDPGDTWSNVYNTVTNATTYDNSGTRIYCEVNQNGTFKQMFRTFVPIDTSLLTSSATISSASLSMKEEDSNFADTDATRVYIGGTSLTSITGVGDFARSNWDESVDYGNKLMSDWTSGVRAGISLTSAGLSYISKTGTTYFSLLNSLDRSTTSPTGINSHGWASADNATWTNKPYLTITYTLSSASGPANLKSLDTNVKANIKSYNTNLLANIKSIDTNA